MEIEPAIADAEGAVDLPVVSGDVRFEHVSFRYPDGTQDVLRDISLHVRPGESIAIIGDSGVGKTTLCQLIPRFFDPTAGCILLDGHDIRDVTLSSLRQSIGIVQQDVYLFSGSVSENIRYGKPGATDEEVTLAAERAGADGFIRALADGYGTKVGHRGVKLSGGQKQRISIARAFLKNPPVLILDEATSALDQDSERVVQASLALLSESRTTFIIAHRLSTIRSADRILVLQHGRVAEIGTHAELLAHGGAYARLLSKYPENYPPAP